MAVLHSSQAQLTRSKTDLNSDSKVALLLGCAVFTIKILAGILKLLKGTLKILAGMLLDTMTCNPKVALFRQKLQFNIQGSDPPYLAVSPELLSDYSFLLGESQHHQLVLNMHPMVFDVCIKTVACAFIFKHSVYSCCPSNPLNILPRLKVNPLL